MQIEINDNETELLLKMLRHGKAKILSQNYLMMRNEGHSQSRLHVDFQLNDRLSKIIAVIEAQIVLLK